VGPGFPVIQFQNDPIFHTEVTPHHDTKPSSFLDHGRLLIRSAPCSCRLRRPRDGHRLSGRFRYFAGKPGVTIVFRFLFSNCAFRFALARSVRIRFTLIRARRICQPFRRPDSNVPDEQGVQYRSDR
jgi:hypothetical protein